MQAITQPRADWRNAFRDLQQEHGFRPLEVQGTLPAELRGTLYRNGPALFSTFGEPYGHWFDGDGAVSAVRIDAGGASGAVRLVQSEGLLEERRAGRRLFGSYGTVVPGALARLRGRYKNAANTSVFAWNGALYALFENGKPTEIDPDDLQTLGTTDFGGAIPGCFSAHPHRVPQRRAFYNFGVRVGRQNLLDLFELPDGGAARRIATLPLPAATMIHDFIATDGHLIFFLSPLQLQVFRMLMGKGSFGENLAWRPEVGTEVVVVPLADPESPIRFHADPFFQFHFSNAFERGGELVVDLVRYADFSINDWLAGLPRGEALAHTPPAFCRAVIDPQRRRLDVEPIFEGRCEFPRVAPSVVASDYRFAWLNVHEGEDLGLFDSLARLDVGSGELRTLSLGEGCYPSEPVFVPRPGATSEEDGWVLTMVYDAKVDRSHLAIVEGTSLEVVARAFFDHALPPTFHGGFAPAK